MKKILLLTALITVPAFAEVNPFEGPTADQQKCLTQLKTELTDGKLGDIIGKRLKTFVDNNQMNPKDPFAPIQDPFDTVMSPKAIAASIYVDANLEAMESALQRICYKLVE